MNAKELITPKEANDEYTKNIASNLRKLMERADYSQNSLSSQLNTMGLQVNQGTISKYLSGKSQIPLSIIVKLCEIFDISFSDLIKKDFSYDNSDYSKTPQLSTEVYKASPRLAIPELGTKFITNPKDEDFKGYLQKYYCYFFPTLSKENQLLKGIIELNEQGTCCEATLTLNTNKTRHGKTVYKHYTGYAIISKAVESFYIILSSAKEGEICVINMRHFFIRHQSLDCRMAEVITNGAGERHFPTVHRMLLSRSPIKDEHLPYLTPHLHLNSSNIFIKKEDLEILENKSVHHKDLIEHLLHRVVPIPTYEFKEDYVISNAGQFLTKDETRIFLSEIRNKAQKTRYNKVSNKLDETVRDLLLSLGYYTDTEGNTPGT